MTGATTFHLYINGYGGPPVVPTTGYRAVLTLYSGSHQLSVTQAISANAWNDIRLNVSAWPYLKAVTEISVSYAGLGTNDIFVPDFQIDDVGYTVG
jgi:hypothetical protein